MGLPPAQVLVRKLTKRFFRKLRAEAVIDVGKAEQELHNSWLQYGYGSPKCISATMAFYRTMSVQEEAEKKFKAEMKVCCGKAMSLMVPPVDKYWKKGRHGPPQDTYMSMPLKPSAFEKKSLRKRQ